ncbi:MAG: Ig-like domain-containing protein, partial [Muribaculaceae bacterium]|nr:Ig-like domain-containing protein [Muribaculaceae bacterium]
MVNGNPDVSLSKRFDESYSLISNLNEHNLLRLGAFSSEHRAIKGNSGSIFDVRLKATDSFEGGIVRLSKLLCITDDDKDIKLPDTSVVVECIIHPKDISISKESVQLCVGNIFQLEATVLPENTSDKTVSWTTADESIATVDATGKVTAVSLGETVITARCEDVSAECKIFVVPTPAESIVLNTASAQLKVGESMILEASV